MTQGKLPPTPHEPAWWDGISWRPKEHESTPLTASNPTTGARDAAAAFRNRDVPPWRNVTKEMILEAQSSQEHIGASTRSRLIAYVTIGNSDDKLQQHDWSNFVRELRAVLSDFAGRTYGEWFSAPDSTWQNMCICKEIEREDLDRLRAALRALRGYYRQDSVALVTSGQTELV